MTTALADLFDMEIRGDPVAPSFDGSQPCAQTDPDLFFPDKGGGTGSAKRICARCEFREPCLEYALVTRIFGVPVAGVWGGTTPSDRRRLRRQRGLPQRHSEHRRPISEPPSSPPAPVFAAPPEPSVAPEPSPTTPRLVRPWCQDELAAAIAECTAAGLSDTEIARELRVTRASIKRHRCPR